MRYLILSDIHANWEALTAVWMAAERDGFDQCLCLGDVVGYGANPNECAQWVRERARLVIRGNHEKACTGMADLEDYNPAAETAALWTRNQLTAENAQWVASLPQGPAPLDGFQLAHGSPADEDEYLTTPYQAEELIGFLAEPVTFIGHTHVQGGFRLFRNRAAVIEPVPAKRQTLEYELHPGSMYLINPGAVGQPRDGDSRAAWALFEPGCQRVTYRRVTYDVESAQRKIRAAGLPDVLAWRLSLGK